MRTCRRHDPAPGGAERRTSFPRTALGSTDHRLLRRRAPVRRPQRLSATENQPRRKSRHRPGPDRAQPARADPASRAVGHPAQRPDDRDARRRRSRSAHRHAGSPSAVAELRGRDGQRYRLEASTRIGRLPDNDIVLDDDDVSRYHAVVIDTGRSFVISDLRSTNGVQVEADASGAAPPWPTATISASAATSSSSKFVAPLSCAYAVSSERKNFARISPGSTKAVGCTLVMSGNSNRPQRRIHLRTWDNCQVRKPP